jgi:hypothetical protein
MAGSAAMVWIAVVLVLGRVWDAMHEKPLEPGVKLHLSLAFLNFVIAGGMGFLLGLNRLVAPLHIGVCLMCLLMTVGVGLILASSRPGTHVMPLALTYGVLGLLGFLGQLIAAVQARMMPLFAWYWVAQRLGASPPQASPYTLPAWRAEPVSAALWTLGVMALAIGAFQQWPRLFSIGAALIGGAATIGLTSLIVTIGVAFMRVQRRRRSGHSALSVT